MSWSRSLRQSDCNLMNPASIFPETGLDDTSTILVEFLGVGACIGGGKANSIIWMRPLACTRARQEPGRCIVPLAQLETTDYAAWRNGGRCLKLSQRRAGASLRQTAAKTSQRPLLGRTRSRREKQNGSVGAQGAASDCGWLAVERIRPGKVTHPGGGYA